jgi:ABC-2 type transport system ATP-binding protein
MLEAQLLTKYFNRKCAVREVSFEIGPGDIVGYLGPNGAGESTTVKMIVGLIRPSSGRILYQGESIEKRMIEFKTHVGYVPEDALL